MPRRLAAALILLCAPALGQMRLSVDAPAALQAPPASVVAAPLPSSALTAAVPIPAAASPALLSAPAAAAPAAAQAAPPAASAQSAPISPAAAKSPREGEPSLRERLRARVAFDGEGDARRDAALSDALDRMLESPTARALAERYAAQGAAATVRFEDIPGTVPTSPDGRAFFHGTRGLTHWTGDSVLVRLNSAYLDSDAHHRRQSLPAILAHELLGHGLWYSRAADENLLQAFHHHDLNEINARLVGWLVDHELDGRMEESGAWTYLRDPSAYTDNLKLRLLYYALTFSGAEMSAPMPALETRLARARERRARLESERANVRSWTPVVDYFAAEGVPEARFRDLRAELAQNDASYAADIASADEAIAGMETVLARFKAETDGASTRYLAAAAAHPMFAELQREVDERLAELRARAVEPQPQAAPAAAAASGQITFDELRRMYEQDRARHPERWR